MSGVNIITAEEVKKKFEAEEPLYMIDVREEFEVANGMIPGAVHIPMNTVPDQLARFNPEVPYIIVCAAGVRSEKVAAYLSANGIQSSSMEGGMYAWTGEIEV
ncbi:MAG: rhodanese-like domain-containing protein [Bacillus sp. (in: firmicutes)]